MADLLESADAAALRLADAAGVTVRMLETVAEFNQSLAVMEEVWGPGSELVGPGLMVALRHTDNYVSGAFSGGRMVGYCVAFRSVAEADCIHSHVAAVVADHVGRSIGTALKFHQRAWALRHGINVIEWTYDPLIARNAAFNLIRLGAEAEQYLVDFYGPMDDEINRNQPSDRLMARWYLDSDKAIAAACGKRCGVPADPDLAWAPVPPDIEGLRHTDLEAAARWRFQLREALAGPMSAGARIVGFDPARGYALRKDA
ncbi:MAG: GNAT family N-acetyltransferase [Propionibacteriaceae bacterium]|jgi:predicted GNAT superfamily acetyltransferase|nr:GNAT family N-acetyltransferase [Propionibacteriaceae bacterium]